MDGLRGTGRQTNISAVKPQISRSPQSKTEEDITLIFKPEELGVTVKGGKKIPVLTVNAEQLEAKFYESFGLDVFRDGELIKQKLGTSDNPFAAIRTTSATGSQTVFKVYLNPKTGNYEVVNSIEKSLYAKLKGKAEDINREIAFEKNGKASSGNLGENTAAKKGIDDSKRLQNELLQKLIRDAQVIPSSFGIPSKLTDLYHVVVTLPDGAAVTEDNALAALVEKQYGGGNLFRQDKINILNAAKQSGVKIENLKVSANNNSVVEFDINLESRLKLQKAYIDAQEKVNGDIAIFDKISREMAVSQFILGVVTGAVEDVKGSLNTIVHPLETLQAISDAVGILSQLSVEDIKTIAAELGKNAPNLTLGQAAYGAGYAVGTIAVEIVLGKGAGLALSALNKTKAGAAFAARLTKLGEGIADVAKAGRAKLAEAFSDEAASLAGKRLLNGNKLYAVLPGAPLPPEVIADFGVIVGNKVGKGVTSFRQVVKEMSAELGEAVKPHLDKLAQSYREMMKKAGLKADENEIITIFKEWEVERAKNINDSIKVPSTAEITGSGWLERKSLREKIATADFPKYEKHIKAKTIDEARVFSETGEKVAQFLPSVHIRLKELYGEGIEKGLNNGLFKKEGGKWVFFHKFEQTIGFNEGKETKWLRIELSGDVAISPKIENGRLKPSGKTEIHGHPTNFEEVRRQFPQQIKGSK